MRTRFSQYLVERVCETASFWRENVIADFILLRAVGKCGIDGNDVKC